MNEEKECQLTLFTIFFHMQSPFTSTCMFTKRILDLSKISHLNVSCGADQQTEKERNGTLSHARLNTT